MLLTFTLLSSLTALLTIVPLDCELFLSVSVGQILCICSLLNNILWLASCGSETPSYEHEYTLCSWIPLVMQIKYKSEEWVCQIKIKAVDHVRTSICSTLNFPSVLHVRKNGHPVVFYWYAYTVTLEARPSSVGCRCWLWLLSNHPCLWEHRRCQRFLILAQLSVFGISCSNLLFWCSSLTSVGMTTSSLEVCWFLNVVLFVSFAVIPSCNYVVYLISVLTFKPLLIGNVQNIENMATCSPYFTYFI